MLPFSDQHRYVIPPSQMENLIFNVTGGKKGEGSGESKEWADKGRKTEMISPAMLKETLEAYGGDEEWTRIEEYDWGTVKFGHLIENAPLSANDYNCTYIIYDKMKFNLNPNFVIPQYEVILPEIAYTGVITTVQIDTTEEPDLTNLSQYLACVYGYSLNGIYTKPISLVQTFYVSMMGILFESYDPNYTFENEYVYKWFEDDTIKLVSVESIQNGDMILDTDFQDIPDNYTCISITSPYTWKNFLQDFLLRGSHRWYITDINQERYSDYLPEVDINGNLTVSQPNSLNYLVHNE